MPQLLPWLSASQVQSTHKAFTLKSFSPYISKVCNHDAPQATQMCRSTKPTLLSVVSLTLYILWPFLHAFRFEAQAWAYCWKKMLVCLYNQLVCYYNQDWRYFTEGMGLLPQRCYSILKERGKSILITIYLWLWVCIFKMKHNVLFH